MEEIVYSVAFFDERRDVETASRIEFKELDPAIYKARELAKEGHTPVFIEPILMREGEMHCWSPFVREYAEHNGRVIVQRITSANEPFPGRVVLDWIALLPARFLDDSLASTLLLDTSFVSEDRELHALVVDDS